MAASLGFTTAASLRETLRSAITEEDEGDKSLSPQERTMLLNVLDFGEARVGEVMIPRADIVAIENDKPVSALFKLFTTLGHSRVPVFQGSLDNPIGMVHIKDAMAWALRKPEPAKDGADEPAADGSGFFGADLNTTLADAKLVREVLFVPPSMPALALLAKMKAKQIHLALVVDEFGGTDGLVTFEDLAEEIIGDIADEHDIGNTHTIGAEGEGFIASGRAPIAAVEQVLRLSLTSGVTEEVGTLGGLILAMVGRVPKRGEIISHPSGVTFEILDASPRRLHKVRILSQRALAAPDKPLLLSAPASQPGGNGRSGLNGAQAA
ncbi:MAG TPA: hemolysin family protein [Hyphomicrobiales bacterium]|nr:hemolysin family protein [Hyphomicrobiales bacterium]